MPTNHKRETIIFTAEEADTLRREATEKKVTLSNLVRLKLELPKLKKGKKLKENPSPETVRQRERRAKKENR